MNFKTPYNATPAKGERNTQPSMTIPDQTLSVKQILDRYAKGLPLGGQKVPIYEADENSTFDDYMPDPKTLDISERHEMAQDAKKELRDIKSKLNKKAREKAEKDLLKSKDEEGSEGKSTN